MDESANRGRCRKKKCNWGDGKKTKDLSKELRGNRKGKKGQGEKCRKLPRGKRANNKPNRNQSVGPRDQPHLGLGEGKVGKRKGKNWAKVARVRPQVWWKRESCKVKKGEIGGGGFL